LSILRKYSSVLPGRKKKQHFFSPPPLTLKERPQSGQSQMSRQEQSKPSAEELRGRIAAGSMNPEDYRHLANHLSAIGQFKEAISFYQEVLDLSLQDIQKADLSTDLAWVLYEVGRRSEAQTLAENAIALLSNQGESVEALLKRGAAYSLLADCASFTDSNSSANMARLGLDALEQVIAKRPDNETVTTAFYFAARIHNLMGDTEKTVPLCEKCLQHELGDRERLECLMILVEALRSQERFAEAERVVGEARRYVGADKQYVEADKRIAQWLSLEIGLIQRLSNRLVDAVETFKQMLVEVEADPALRNHPSISGTVWWNLAAVLCETSDYEGAASAFEKALIIHPPNEPYHYKILLSLGDCYLGTAAYAKARGCYEKVVASAYS
jgi:tetratricopeptide (TPR) repeat protein